MREKVTFELEPVNPQMDINPTGECKVEIRDIETWDESGDTHIKVKEMACIYKGKGRCVGTITPERLTILRKLYDGAVHNHENMSPPPRSFEEEIVDLIIRYKQRKVDMKSHQNDWSIPPNIRAVLTKHFGTNKERFASPLNVLDNTNVYWSTHLRDQVFGARTDATFQQRWSGSSHAFPNKDPALYKAMRWALWSASTTNTPTATVLFLPRGMRTMGKLAYQKWVDNFPHFCTRSGRSAVG